MRTFRKVGALKALSPVTGRPTQVWDGSIGLKDTSGNSIGTITGWNYTSPNNLVIEIYELTDPGAYFNDGEIRASHKDTSVDEVWTLQRSLESSYSATGSKVWGLTVTKNETGITQANIDSKLASPSLTGMQEAWYRVEQGNAGGWTKVALLYRVMEDVTIPTRTLDQWFYGAAYTGPNESGTVELKFTRITGTVPSFNTLKNEIQSSGTWRYQRCAWHTRKYA